MTVKAKVYFRCSVESKDDHKRLLNKLFDLFNSEEVEAHGNLVALKVGVPKKHSLLSKTVVEEHIFIGELVSHGLKKENLLDANPISGGVEKALPGHSRRCWISVVMRNTLTASDLQALFSTKPEVKALFEQHAYLDLPFEKGAPHEQNPENEVFILCLAAIFQEKRARSLGIIRLIDVMVV